MNSLLEIMLARLQAFRRDQAGNAAMMFTLALIPLVGMVGAAVDYGRANSVKVAIQAGVDATALMLARDPTLPSMTPTQLQTAAQGYFTAEFHRSYAQNVVVASSYTQKPPTVTVSGTASVDTVIMGLLGVSKMNVSSAATVRYSPPKTISLNIAFDSSASMIVGATTNDVTLIANWVSKNWNLVKPGDPAPKYPGGDNPPCAFACHDVGGSTTPADIATGLTNAHTAGATTRFDVMIAAAQQLISHVQTEVTNTPQLAGNTYLFNIMSFDTTLNQWGPQNTNFSGASTAVKTVSPGLDTHLYSAMSQLITKIGMQGDGSSASSPVKFLILITDGLQSDRNQNWGCGYWGWDSAWGYNTCFNAYATTIDATQCQKIKSNGIVLAVLETPYVPLTAQSPNVAPYEKTVRHVIYPGGPNSASVVSQALQNCATTGYYFQATNSSDIQTGFLTLTDKFLNTVPYLSR